MFENLLPDKASEAIYSATKYSGQICQPILMFLILLSFSRAVAQEAPGRGIDALRIENEVKLSVPEALADSVWNYLLQTYLDGTPDFLRNHIPPFSYQVATDSFVDQYYDTHRFSLLQLRSGARYRQRFSLSGAGGEKDGRELIQLKMDSEGSNALSRGEYKYDVEHYQKAEEPLDYHPFMGRVKRGQRDELISRLKEYGINPESLSPTIRITQIRRRLYFFTGDRPFSTLTLDAVTADYQGKALIFMNWSWSSMKYAIPKAKLPKGKLWRLSTTWCRRISCGASRASYKIRPQSTTRPLLRSVSPPGLPIPATTSSGSSGCYWLASFSGGCGQAAAEPVARKILNCNA
ncbi:hypothetical protein [Phaeodactylibacter xiamenensis]|uniref:hypothetical protein n=1 Tax=Phaeodactylibacter xiamenensis TaxID=1524460 RepID=UPI0024A95FF5|nr:hypothetical protein [Phaeodactylibacter xiamenensis]